MTRIPTNISTLQVNHFSSTYAKYIDENLKQKYLTSLYTSQRPLKFPIFLYQINKDGGFKEHLPLNSWVTSSDRAIETNRLRPRPKSKEGRRDPLLLWCEKWAFFFSFSFSIVVSDPSGAFLYLNPWYFCIVNCAPSFLLHRLDVRAHMVSHLFWSPWFLEVSIPCIISWFMTYIHTIKPSSSATWDHGVCWRP